FLLPTHPPPHSPPFPYTTLFRSRPAPRSPLPAPRYPHAGWRTGSRHLRRHRSRRAGSVGDPVAVAAGRSRDEVAAYLALAQLPGIGAARLATLVAAFQSAPAAFHAPHGAIAALPGFTRAAATAIRAGSARAGLEILDALDRLGATVLRSEEHTSELQSRSELVCRLLLEKKKRTP